MTFPFHKKEVPLDLRTQIGVKSEPSNAYLAAALPRFVAKTKIGAARQRRPFS
jgi:hypothetical protein